MEHIVSRKWLRGSWALVGGLAIVVLLATSVAEGAQAQSSNEDELDRAVASRSRYGFEADRAHVKNLLSRSNHPASDEYGFPLTANEAQDLLERSTFVQRLSKKTLPFARGLDEYAGAWIDQSDGGRLVIGLTDARESLKDAIRARLPNESRGVRFEEVNDSARALSTALDRAAEDWDDLGTGIIPQAVVIHYRHNRVTVRVRQSQLDLARQFKSQLKDRLGVDVAFSASPRISDLAPGSACGGRKKCYGPFRLGVRVNFPKSYPDSGITSYCGMAFHIIHPTNSSSSKHKTFMTAGHCVHNNDDPWHHHDDYKSYYGRKVGGRKATKYTSENRDVALVKILDWSENKSTRIYDDSDWSNGANLTDEDEPMEGETLCMSLAQKDKNWCGEADAHAGWWISTTANIKVYGGGIDFPNNPSRSTVFGDSGSPIFRKWISGTVPSVPQRTPIGIVNAGSSDTPDEKEEHAIYFAKVQWALNNSAGWPNLEIYQGGQGSP